MQSSKPKPVAPTIQSVAPWNKGAFVGPKPPLKPKQVWSIRLKPFCASFLKHNNVVFASRRLA